MGANAAQNEIERVNRLSRQIIDAYVAWGRLMQTGEVHQMMYSDIMDFVNFRIETADTCLTLIEQNKIPDALGLCRSLLEHYLLLMLMCRGRRYFQLQDLQSKSPEEFNEYFEQQKADLIERQANGHTSCLYVAKYPRAKRHLMYAFEGLKDSTGEGFSVPVHYFQFQEFHPETMRLKDEDDFIYHEPGPIVTEAQKGHRLDATHNYRHYLSYDGLLQCLELNGLVDAAALSRIEAHYTFLGRFLHPTHNAARDLHDRHVMHIGSTSVGLRQYYSRSASLLATVYVAYLIAGLVDEVAGMIEDAPSKYVADAATAGVRGFTRAVPQSCAYFWFLFKFNEAPLYDRFNHASRHLSDEDLANYGGYAGVPSDQVMFNQYIFDNFQQSLQGRSNQRCGVYISPLPT